jgi:protein tyrosine/serine phosphatase
MLINLIISTRKSYFASVWRITLSLKTGEDLLSNQRIQVIRSAILVLLLSFLTAAAVPAETPNLNIKNFGCINQNYYRGSQPEGQQYVDLAKMGIRTVINLTSDDANADEKKMVEAAGMKYVQIPMTTHVPPTPAQIAEFMKIANDPESQPVYVHCVGGKHRTGVMTAIYRMNDGWTADQAFKEMKQYKFGATFLHSEFKKFVYDFYQQLLNARSDGPAPASAVAVQ